MDGIASIISQLERQRDAIDRALSALRGVARVTTPSIEADRKTTAAGAPKRKVSASTRRKMAEAQQRRYAALRGKNVAVKTETTPKTAKNTKPAKRKMSAQGLANIRAGVKKRLAMAKKASAPTE